MIHVQRSEHSIKDVFCGDKKITSVQWQGKEFLPKWQKIELSTKGVSAIDGDFSVEPKDWMGYHEVVLKDEENPVFDTAFYKFRSEFIRLLPSFKAKSSISTVLMFSRCERLRGVDLSSLDTSKTEKMGSMFSNCSALESLDLSNFDTSSVSSMGSFFLLCKNLKKVNLASFDTSKVTSFLDFFNGCEKLNGLDLSNFDTSSAKSLAYMFKKCSSLKELNLSSFDTSNVINMNSMFSMCSSLVSLDLSSFDTSNTKNMDLMFEGCKNLKTVYCRTQEDAERLAHSTPAEPSEPGTEPVYTEFIVK